MGLALGPELGLETRLGLTWLGRVELKKESRLGRVCIGLGTHVCNIR